MDTNIVLSAIDTNNKKVTKTLPDINPDAEPAALKNFAQSLNNLTTNTYGGSTRVIKTNLDDAQPSTPKLPRNLVLGTYASGDFETIQPVLNNSITEAGVRYQGSSDPCYIQFPKTQTQFGHMFAMDSFEADDEDPLYLAFRGSFPFGSDTTPWTIQVYVPESDTYLAETLTITIQGGNA